MAKEIVQEARVQMDAIEKNSPFIKATSQKFRLKLFVWGDSGSGKTTLAVQAPKPAVVDLEGGAGIYGGEFDFDILKATSADEISGAVEWLLANHHDYRTLVIDPVTVYWDALQQKWRDIFLRRNRASKGHRQEYYSLQAKDWQTIKAEHKELVRKLIQLDMNVIVTARQKTLYADQGFMRAIGETFDGEKTLPYLFDTILRLYRDDRGRFMAENLKDRTNKLPRGNFEISYQILEDRLGKESLGRKSVPVPLATSDQLTTLRHFIAVSGMSDQVVRKRLLDYGADCLEALTEQNAQLIIDKFEAAGVQPAQSQTSAEESHNATD